MNLHTEYDIYTTFTFTPDTWHTITHVLSKTYFILIYAKICTYINIVYDTSHTCIQCTKILCVFPLISHWVLQSRWNHIAHDPQNAFINSQLRTYVSTSHQKKISIFVGIPTKRFLFYCMFLSYLQKRYFCWHTYVFCCWHM